MAYNQCLKYIKNLCNVIIFLMQLISIVIQINVIYPFISMKINERMSVILCCIIQILFIFGSISIYCKVINFINRYDTNNNTYNRL